jgi:hypothetical protein
MFDGVFSSLLWNPMIHFRLHTRLLLGLILSQLNTRRIIHLRLILVLLSHARLHIPSGQAASPHAFLISSSSSSIFI